MTTRMSHNRSNHRVPFAALALLTLAACGGEVSSNEQARRAYLGLDTSIEKALQLGFAGFNAASSANIPEQRAPGNSTGQLTITGQVDQGSSDNKGMRLRVGMTDYSDGPITLEDEKSIVVTYDTAEDVAARPALDLSMKDLPNGTFSGTLVGDFDMTGDLKDKVNLNLTLTGELEDDGTGKVRRKTGSTTVVGTATSGSSGTWQVDVKL